VGISKINPFMFVNQVRGHEVHLPDYTPTSLANTGLLGSGHDRSNPSTGYYYKDINGLPWALMLPKEFDYPKEKASITSAYGLFAPWAISGGTAYTDWYFNTPGYRNTDNIY
jgi:LruC domain-containing protein